MTTLNDLLDPAELAQMIVEKRIAKQVHPSLPISIYNYTNRAQFMNKWSKSERVCRGLIVEDGTNRIVARGPSKFMNYGDPKAPETTLDTIVRVTKKHDGSLGIGWKYQDQYGIATRGSFTSEQAIHATAQIDHLIRAQIDEAELDETTPVYEIVYPENRIVLDYEGRDELIELGEVNLADGNIRFRPSQIFHEVHEKKPYIRLSTALELPIPSDEEGYVLDLFEKFPGGYLKNTGHVKLKGEEYKILHGLLTNTNARRIWVQLAARDCYKLVEQIAEENEKEVEKVWATYVGHDPEEFKRVNVEKDIVETLLTNVPDEFYDWVTKKIDAINDTVSDLIIQSIMLGGQVSLIGDKRKRHELLKDHPLCKEILNYIEDRDLSRITLKAWKLAKPEGDDTPFRTEED